MKINIIANSFVSWVLEQVDIVIPTQLLAAMVVDHDVPAEYIRKNVGANYVKKYALEDLASVVVHNYKDGKVKFEPIYPNRVTLTQIGVTYETAQTTKAQVAQYRVLWLAYVEATHKSEQESKYLISIFELLAAERHERHEIPSLLTSEYIVQTLDQWGIDLAKRLIPKGHSKEVIEDWFAGTVGKLTVVGCDDYWKHMSIITHTMKNPPWGNYLSSTKSIQKTALLDPQWMPHTVENSTLLDTHWASGVVEKCGIVSGYLLKVEITIRCVDPKTIEAIRSNVVCLDQAGNEVKLEFLIASENVSIPDSFYRHRPLADPSSFYNYKRLNLSARFNLVADSVINLYGATKSTTDLVLAHGDLEPVMAIFLREGFIIMGPIHNLIGQTNNLIVHLAKMGPSLIITITCGDILVTAMRFNINAHRASSEYNIEDDRTFSRQFGIASGIQDRFTDNNTLA